MSLASIGRCGAQPSQGPGRGRTVGPGAVHTFFGMGRVHKLVLGSLNPHKITTPLNITLHFLLSKITLHPALQSGLIHMREAMPSEGTICRVNTVGMPGILMSHTCVDWIYFLSGRLIVRGVNARRLLSTCTRHDENGGSACVNNGLIGGNRYRVEVLQHGVAK